MPHDAEKNGAQLSAVDDQRVIPAMRWMRMTRFDEIPQIWNVLRGQMSLVGPRPERPELFDRIEREVDGYSQRLQMLPGITGLAQVYGRYNTSPAHKLGYDLQYLVNWSVFLDLHVLVRTLVVVLLRRT